MNPADAIGWVPPPRPKPSGRPRVYIAGPITRGNLAANVNRATAAFVALAKAGFAPFCPHWSVYSKPCEPSGESECECTGTRDGNGEMGHGDWIGVDLPWVSCADALLRLPGDSLGADAEVSCAILSGVPIFFSVEDVIRWHRG